MSLSITDSVQQHSASSGDMLSIEFLLSVILVNVILPSDVAPYRTTSTVESTNRLVISNLFVFEGENVKLLFKPLASFHWKLTLLGIHKIFFKKLSCGKGVLSYNRS